MVVNSPDLVSCLQRKICFCYGCKLAGLGGINRRRKAKVNAVCVAHHSSCQSNELSLALVGT